MRLLMVGAPGAGKGTQAERLAKHYHVAHLSSGDLFRREVAAGTPIGRVAEEYLARGDLVPDEVVIEMLREPVLKAARSGGYVLDGFPRTVVQAEEAYRIAVELQDVTLQAVVHLDVPRAELRRRLLERAEREGRTDDTERTIAHRLDVYEQQTAPLLEFYAGRGLVVNIDGDQPPDDVFRDTVSALDELRAAQR